MKKKPECFLSNPSPQARAENDCFTCSFQSECFKKEYCKCENTTHTAGLTLLGEELIICTECNKEMQISLESVDDHIKEKLKNPEFKKAYDENQGELKKMIDEIHLQSDIEDVLDTFTSRINLEFAKDYIDIRREIARELLAKIGGHYESKK